MTEANGGDREERAKEALIVSALYRDDSFDENVDVDRLPELTEEEKMVLESLGPDFVARLFANEIETKTGDLTGELPNVAEDELAMAGGAVGFGLDRAEEIDDLTSQELEKQRQELLERKRREQEKDGNSD
jgi:hypothetical protein